MSFITELNKQTSKKIAIFEYDEGLNISEFISYEAGIYFKQFDKSRNATSTSNFPLSYYYTNQDNVEYTNIKSLKIGIENYTLVSSIAAMRSQVKSFYFDISTQTVYFRFVNDEPVLDKIVKLGIVQGFLADIDETGEGCYYNDIYYEPRITKLPALQKTKDPLFFGLLKYQNLSVDVINSDGEFDDFTDKDIYGQATRWMLGFEGLNYADYVQISSGYIYDPSWSYNNLTITVQDGRKKLEREIPYNKYTQLEYPFLSDENNGSYKPIAYGDIKNAKAVCIDENVVAPTNNTFHYMDTEFNDANQITKVETVFQDNTTDVTASTLNGDLSAGTFQLPNAVCFSGGELKDVFVTFTGSDGIENGMDVMKDIYLNYGETSFLSTNFNIAEWNAETNLSKNIGLYKEKPTKINKIFEEICKSINGLWFIQDDSLITTRVYNPDRNITKEIRDYDWLNEPKFKKPVKEYLSSVIVQHSQDYKYDSSYSNYENIDYQADALKKYKVYSQKTIKTLLTNETDAIAVSNNLMSRSYDVKETVTRKTTIEHYDLKVMDFIVTAHDRDNTDFGIYEIVGKKFNLKDYTIDLTMKKIQDYDYVYRQGVIANNLIANSKIAGGTVGVY